MSAVTRVCCSVQNLLLTNTISIYLLIHVTSTYIFIIFITSPLYDQTLDNIRHEKVYTKSTSDNLLHNCYLMPEYSYHTHIFYPPPPPPHCYHIGNELTNQEELKYSNLHTCCDILILIYFVIDFIVLYCCICLDNQTALSYGCV